MQIVVLWVMTGFGY